MRFIRVHGRVVPIKDKGAASGPAKRKYPPVDKLGAGTGAKIGAAGGLAGLAGWHYADLAIKGKTSVSTGKIAKFVGAGALIGAALGSIRYTKRAKGETQKHLAKRVSETKPGITLRRPKK